MNYFIAGILMGGGFMLVGISLGPPLRNTSTGKRARMSREQWRLLGALVFSYLAGVFIGWVIWGPK